MTATKTFTNISCYKFAPMRDLKLRMDVLRQQMARNLAAIAMRRLSSLR